MPLPRKDKKMRHCFTVVSDSELENNYRVAKVIENESGYYPLVKRNNDDPHELDKYIGSQDEVRAKVDLMNKHLGVDKDREWEIKASTMFKQ